jgi:hypothetical protein
MAGTRLEWFISYLVLRETPRVSVGESLDQETARSEYWS